MNDFFKTIMGRKLFESDIPDLIKSLNSLSKELKTLNERQEKMFKLDEKLKRLQIKEHLNKVNEDTK
jgi:hypothetical protein